MCKKLASHVNPHQRCEYTDSPFARIHDCILQGPEMSWRVWTSLNKGWTSGGARHSKGVVLRQSNTVLAYVKDFKQGQKIFQDLLISTTKPTDPVEGELPETMNMTQVDPKSQTSGCPLFGCLENRRIPAGGQHSKRV